MNNLLRRKDFFSSHNRKLKKLKDLDLVLWIIPSLLVILGSCLIASTQRNLTDASWVSHASTGLIGLFCALFIAQSPLERIRNYLIPIYIFTVVSLISVLLFGTTAFGAQRWLTFAGLNIQPSEIAKLSSIFILAEILSANSITTPSQIVKPLSLILVPWYLIFLQPDLGTSLVFGAILFAMLYWAGMPFEWAFIVISCVITAIFAGIFKWFLLVWIPFLGYVSHKSLPWKKTKIISLGVIASQIAIAFLTPWLWLNVLQDYQRQRLTLFINPGQDPFGGGYHLIQSTIGIGSGGLFGTGLLNGQLTKLNFIPEQHTDFIFSALGEETGFLGSVCVVCAFFFLIIRLIKLAQKARTDFESLVVIGIASMFIFQVIVNIFMTIGLGPVTGIPLPFLSYGRTALMVNFISIGLCISVSKRSKSLSKNL